MPGRLDFLSVTKSPLAQLIVTVDGVADSYHARAELTINICVQ